MGLLESRPVQSSPGECNAGEDPSAFECFPREIAWRIFEYAPESVSNLRLTSPILRDLVDEYAQQSRTIKIVDELTLYGSREREPPHQVLVVIDVPKSHSALFELRLRLRDPNNIERSKLKREDHFEHPSHAYSYKFTMDPLDIDGTFLAWLGASMGRRIGKMALLGCSEGTFELAAQLLDGLHFSKMTFRTRMLSKTAANQMLAMVEASNVESITLKSFKAADDCDTAQFLIELSKIVRAIHIVQANVEARENAYLFGACHVDWSSVILEMFDNKIDKLWIENKWFPAYLPIASADMIRQRLPLIGKNVWFKATCEAYATGLNESINDHWVLADYANYISTAAQPKCYQFLKILHYARMDEHFEN